MSTEGPPTSIDLLDALTRCERTLLNKLQGDLGSPRANWKRDDSVLRAEMRRGRQFETLRSIQPRGRN